MPNASAPPEDPTARTPASVPDNAALLQIALRVGRLGAWRVDLPGERVRWNEAARAIHGIPTGVEPELETVLAMYVAEDRARMRELQARCITSGEPFDAELRLVTADGRPVWVRAIGEAVRGATGEVVRIEGVVQDITEPKRVELALRASEERFYLMAHAANVTFFEWDAATDGVWRTGSTQPGNVGETTVTRGLESIGAYLHPADRARVMSGMRAAIDGSAASWSDEFRAETPRGTVHVVARAHILRDGAGRALRMVGGVTDITELKRASERLAEQAALLDKAQDAIMVRDLEHRVLYWNRSCERLFGWTAEEALGRVAPELLRVDPTVSASAIEAVITRGEWSGEVDKLDKDGQVHTIEARWSLVRDDAGAPRAVFSIDTDISARKRLEQQVMRSQRLESLGTLAGGIAHDLNNVLAPILMSAVLLEKSETDTERREDLATIRTCAERGADMVKQLLAFARGQVGDRARLDLADNAADIERLVRDTFPRNIVVRFEIAKERWRVRADATQMHQMLLNLCLNARDAMPRGGTLTVGIEPHVVDEVQASMHPDAKAGPYLLVRVEDNGIGMAPEVLERIFEPFFTTKPSGQGTGFGLSTVHSIVRAHGGFISVYSEPGQGARFRVHLPADIGASEPSERARPGQELPPSGQGELVLVVDDEETIRFVTQRTLERFGYRVLVAAHGAEAVGLFARHKDDVAVVLTDMAMPIMDGPATIVALRAMSPGVRVIGSSGLGADGLVAKSIDAGARWFVDKPYTADALLRVLRRALRGDVG